MSKLYKLDFVEGIDTTAINFPYTLTISLNVFDERFEKRLFKQLYDKRIYIEKTPKIIRLLSKKMGKYTVWLFAGKMIPLSNESEECHLLDLVGKAKKITISFKSKDELRNAKPCVEVFFEGCFAAEEEKYNKLKNEALSLNIEGNENV